MKSVISLLRYLAQHCLKKGLLMTDQITEQASRTLERAVARSSIETWQGASPEAALPGTTEAPRTSDLRRGWLNQRKRRRKGRPQTPGLRGPGSGSYRPRSPPQTRYACRVPRHIQTVNQNVGPWTFTQTAELLSDKNNFTSSLHRFIGKSGYL